MENYKQLIQKYLHGELSDAGVQLLLSWLNQSAENRRLFVETKRKHQPLSDSRSDEAWHELKLKIENRARLRSDFEQIAPKGKKIALRVLQMAAVLLVGVAASWFLFSQTAKTPSQNSAPTAWWKVEAPKGQKNRLTLPDGSKVWLNSESHIQMPDNFLQKRVVRLSGEAFFDVKNTENSTFTVKTNDYDIEVTGTRFNVMAYSDFGRTETTLAKGKVRIKRKQHIVELKPGEKVIFSQNKLIKSKAHVAQAVSWKDNKFYFESIPFAELEKRLERWYDVEILVRDTSLYDIVFSGYFKNQETLWQVLDVIKMTTPIKYERKDFRQIVIDRAK